MLILPKVFYRKSELKISMIGPILHVQAENVEVLSSMFLRFQEFYEHKVFKNKIFTHEEYIKYEINKFGSFKYTQSWCGFNLPKECFEPFIDGRFKNITPNEKQLIHFFKKSGAKCVIGTTNENSKSAKQTLMHELAHAMYYTNSEYRSIVNLILRSLDLKKVYKELRALGYAKESLRDEAHAYISCENWWLKLNNLKTDEIMAARKTLRALIKLYLQKLNSK